MKKSLRVFFTLAVLLTAAAAQVRAQQETLEELRGRLPENTIFYLSWDHLKNFDQIRAANPLLRLLDSQEMQQNWAMIKDYYKRLEEVEEARKKKQQEAEKKEGQKESSASRKKKKRPDVDIKWEDVVRLSKSPGLFAVVLPPASDGAEGTGSTEPEMVLLYDTTGQEEFIEKFFNRFDNPGWTQREYEFEGLRVQEDLDAEGKSKGVETRIGRWLAASSDKETGEAWFRALQAAPARSLKDVETYSRAGAFHKESSQLEFFMNIGALSGLIEREMEAEKKKKAERQKEAEGQAATPPEPDIPSEKILEAFGLKDWDFVLFGLAFEPERVRYNISGIESPGRSEDSPRIIASPVTSFPSLALAPEDALGYSVTQMNLGAIWGYIERAMTMLLPPQQKRIVNGMKGGIEGVLGVGIQELADIWGPEYSQTHYVEGEGEEQEVKRLVAIQIQNKELMMTVLRNLLPMAAGRLTVTESESDLATFFEIAPVVEPGKEAPKPDYVAALSDGWLLVGPSRTVVESALARPGAGPSLGDNPAVQEVRSRLPAELSTFSFIDFDRWLESGELEKMLNKYGEQIAEQVRQQEKTRRRAEEIAKQQEEMEAAEASLEENPDQEPLPEAAELQQPEPPPSETPATEVVEEDILKVEFPLLIIPRGFLKWLFSGTTRDARGLHHIGVIE